MSTDLSKQIDESRYWQLSFALAVHSVVEAKQKQVQVLSDKQLLAPSDGHDDLHKQLAEPDMIAQVGEMIARAARGEYTCDVTADIGETSDNAILVASARSAEAAEIRGVRNELSDFTRAWVSRQ